MKDFRIIMKTLVNDRNTDGNEKNMNQMIVKNQYPDIVLNVRIYSSSAEKENTIRSCLSEITRSIFCSVSFDMLNNEKKRNTGNKLDDYSYETHEFSDFELSYIVKKEYQMIMNKWLCAVCSSHFIC